MQSRFLPIPETDCKLSSLEQRLLGIITRFDKANRQCFASDARLAAMLQCHEQSVRRARARLLKLKLIRWGHRSQKPQRYVTTKAPKMDEKKEPKTEQSTTPLCSKIATNSCSKIATNFVAELLQDLPVDNKAKRAEAVKKIVASIAAHKSIY